MEKILSFDELRELREMIIEGGNDLDFDALLRIMHHRAIFWSFWSFHVSRINNNNRAEIPQSFLGNGRQTNKLFISRRTKGVECRIDRSDLKFKQFNQFQIPITCPLRRKLSAVPRRRDELNDSLDLLIFAIYFIVIVKAQIWHNLQNCFDFSVRKNHFDGIMKKYF